MTGSTMMAVRAALGQLHATLLDVTRVEHEREHGRVNGAGALLQLVAYDEGFAWLRPLSQLLVSLDEGEVYTLAGAREAVDRLMSGEGEFARRYLGLLQVSPDVVIAHGGVRRALGPMPLAA